MRKRQRRNGAAAFLEDRTAAREGTKLKVSGREASSCPLTSSTRCPSSLGISLRPPLPAPAATLSPQGCPTPPSQLEQGLALLSQANSANSSGGTFALLRAGPSEWPLRSSCPSPSRVRGLPGHRTITAWTPALPLPAAAWGAHSLTSPASVNTGWGQRGQRSLLRDGDPRGSSLLRSQLQR